MLPAEGKFSTPGIDVLRKAFDICKLEAVSLREGGLSGLFGGHRHGGAALCSFVVDFAMHARFVVPQGSYLLCYFHHVAHDSWCAGMPLSSNMVLTVLPHSGCEVMLGPESRISMLLAPLHAGVTHVVEAHPDSFGSSGKQFSLFRPECHTGTLFGSRFAALFESLAGNAGYSLSRLVDSGIADDLVNERTLGELVANGVGRWPCSRGDRLHYSAFRQAVQFMRTHLHRDIYIEEVANLVQMSDRSLRYVFDDLLGVSPTRYLSLLRLHEASRQLTAPSGSRPSIKAVAMSCGLWDLSRFSANYRRAFGEHPSDTLARAQGVAA